MRALLALAVAVLLAAGAAQASGPLDPGFDAIVSSSNEENHAAVKAKMEAWVAAHPRDPLAPRGLLWMAQLDAADGQGERGRPLLERVIREGPDTDWSLHAQKQLADLDLERHRYSAAIETYQRLAREPNPFWQYVGQSAAQQARSRRARFLGLLASLALLVLVNASRLIRIGVRALWPAPSELKFALPVLALIFFAAFSQEPAERQAVVGLALGGMALLWINGAYLSKRSPQGFARVLQALIGVLQACALFYIAIIASDLWEKLVDTWQMGAD